MPAGGTDDLERSVGTYLYGRAMYETMAGWETDPTLATQSALIGDFAQTSWPPVSILKNDDQAYFERAPRDVKMLKEVRARR